MKLSLMRVVAYAALSCFLPLGSGCSGDSAPKRIALNGKLLEGPTPFVYDASKMKLAPGTSVPPGARFVQVLFIPQESGDVTPANVDSATGTFTVSLVPGKYKVAVTASPGPTTPDYFKGQFSREKTKIERDVQEGTEIVIDLTKPNG